MRTAMSSLRFKLLSLIIAVTPILITAPATAQTPKILHSFSDLTSDGLDSLAPLVFDAAGNLYGTTYYGGFSDEGTVFRLSPKANGWTVNVLYSFSNNFVDGYQPMAGVVLDSAGNIYGTTNRGGNGPCKDPLGNVIGCGTVFELVKQPGGTYDEQILYNFKVTGYDGQAPTAGLIFDSAGNLYGTTKGGTIGNGAIVRGTVFELSPSTEGTWTETILWAFNLTDGANPNGSLIFDSAGNLYGTTAAGGGTRKNGTVFELSPSGTGTWTEKVLHSFSTASTDVSLPEASLIFDSAGNLYGTGSFGGPTGGGGVFKLSPSASGTWTETILYFFGVIPDGNNSWGSLIFDAKGNLYGTTTAGGSGQCVQEVVIGCGTIFKLTPSKHGAWTDTAYSFDFTSNGDVEGPEAGLISDSKGNLYGTTTAGGANSDGTVFKFMP
jgi:uncharacterized repeat protein (TIGR03803 family)